MNTTPDPNVPADVPAYTPAEAQVNADDVTQAEGKLARLGVQVEAMQAVLVRLLQDVVQAEHRLDQSQTAQLVEANEQLVMAALASQTEADTVTQALLEAEKATVLDALTGLPNRTALLDRFAQVLASARRQGSGFALLFLDLNEFKPINDQHGHVFGDKVLCMVAERMLSVVREVDTVSRHGGDEFLVLLPGLQLPADAQTVAEKLLAAISAPMVLDGCTVSVTASIGIALYPEDGDTFDALLARADAAMYVAKHQAKSHRGGGFAARSGEPIDGAGPAARPAPPARPPTPPPAHSDDGDVATLKLRLSQLREANEQLVVSALGAEQLRAAAEQAQQRQAAFLEVVAEELRNPMAPVRIAAAMLGRPPADEPLMERVQGIVAQQMKHMARLVESASGSTGALKLEHRPVDLAQVIAAAVAAQRPLLDERQQHFECHCPTGALAVLGDAPALQQIVSNLLDNASQHTHEGGHVDVSVALDAEHLVMTVTDDGIGITQPMLRYIFEPFVQDTHALGFNGGGLGIGLTVVRALVLAHGGTLSAHSAGQGCGSHFVVTLPRAPDAPPAPDAPDAPGVIGVNSAAGPGG